MEEDREIREIREIMRELDRWFDSVYAPCSELTEEELEEIEERADRWLMDTQGL